jgi:hypothetical protein
MRRNLTSIVLAAVKGRWRYTESWLLLAEVVWWDWLLWWEGEGRGIYGARSISRDRRSVEGHLKP